MTQAVMNDITAIRSTLDLADPATDEAWAGIESFINIALRVFAQTNHSKLREVMRLVEIQARMDGKKVFE